jgi:pescadillo
MLFSHLNFYLSTEVPRYSLEFVVLAAGGTILEDPNSPLITHYITDREGIAQAKSREYVQPQWIYDSLNFNRLLDVKEYWVGKDLPAHLSPFVDENDTERYVPER